MKCKICDIAFMCLSGSNVMRTKSKKKTRKHCSFHKQNVLTEKQNQRTKNRRQSWLVFHHLNRHVVK